MKQSWKEGVDCRVSSEVNSPKTLLHLKICDTGTAICETLQYTCMYTVRPRT